MHSPTLILPLFRPYGVARKKTQRGAFDPISVIITVVIIGILATLAVSNFSGDSTRATKLLNNLKIYSDGMKRVKLDTGCYPKQLQTIKDNTFSGASQNFCGVDISATWHGPYVDNVQTDSNGNGLFSDFSSAVATISTQPTPATGLGTFYQIDVSNIPSSTLYELGRICNNSKTSGGTFNVSPVTTCIINPGSGSSSVGSVSILIEETN
ncbi:hypothetical protein ICN48_06490 [Polynucleobacter sp. JS-Safj-400b-B2]|uniref:hypothetical protein n=1 Tax=Polynucleobacter sp. JS-Safj-400b-B2 TaxID=2576921 RepID=UPI001C0E0DC8|nr:hypothetical protein [Polynucleobacter sp. JS-Safj-400b-B2]MBU3625881.1 hypothetical protein [Polynucleobacter sp. JS-Safj-400b-B2]